MSHRKVMQRLLAMDLMILSLGHMTIMTPELAPSFQITTPCQQDDLQFDGLNANQQPLHGADHTQTCDDIKAKWKGDKQQQHLGGHNTKSSYLHSYVTTAKRKRGTGLHKKFGFIPKAQARDDYVIVVLIG
ncbi:hypothetical protein TNCV_548361 [Trichonephila clavipes]|nr:hypothetical protein TNCV_548361 [Trichonephila clavipes]